MYGEKPDSVLIGLNRDEASLLDLCLVGGKDICKHAAPYLRGGVVNAELDDAGDDGVSLGQHTAEIQIFRQDKISVLSSEIPHFAIRGTDLSEIHPVCRVKAMLL